VVVAAVVEHRCWILSIFVVVPSPSEIPPIFANLLDGSLMDADSKRK